MAVTGAEKWYLAVLVFGTDFKIFEIPRDEAEIEMLISCERIFWEQHVLLKNPPEADGKAATTEAIKKMYPQHQLATMVFSENIEQIDKYLELKEQSKKLADEITLIENTLKAEMKSSETLKTNKHIVAWRTQGRKKLNTNRLKEDCPKIDLTKYYDSQSVRVFSVKKLREV